MSAFNSFLRPKHKDEDRNRPMTDEETRQYEADKAANLKLEQDRETVKARQWLHDRGICDKKLEGPERRKKLQAYVKTLVKPKPGHDWAESIIESYEKGDYMNEYGYRLACDAMHHTPIKVDRGEPF
jgi:hypothetical protein